MRQLDPPVKLVAAIGIGELGFFGSEMEILDLVGLTNRHIARSNIHVDGLITPGHQKSDASYVLSRRPDVIYIPKLGEAALLLPTVAALHREPRLSQEYKWDDHLQAYVRLAELRRLP